MSRKKIIIAINIVLLTIIVLIFNGYINVKPIADYFDFSDYFAGNVEKITKGPDTKKKIFKKKKFVKDIKSLEKEVPGGDYFFTIREYYFSAYYSFKKSYLRYKQKQFIHSAILFFSRDIKKLYNSAFNKLEHLLQ